MWGEPWAPLPLRGSPPRPRRTSAGGGGGGGGCVPYPARSASGRAGGRSAPPSSRRGRRGGCTRKCCCRSALPVREEEEEEEEEEEGVPRRHRLPSPHQPPCKPRRGGRQARGLAAPSTYLRQAQVHRGSLRDVHDLAIRSHDKYETVQRLRERVEGREVSTDQQTDR